MTAQEKIENSFYRINNDFYGNPRYVVHFLEFQKPRRKGVKHVPVSFDEAHKLAKNLGMQKYRGKQFGGMFVFTTYNTRNTAKLILKARNQFYKENK